MRSLQKPQVFRGNAGFMLQVGEGRHATCSQLDSDYMQLPKSMIVQPSAGRSTATIFDLIDSIYGEIQHYYTSADYFSARALLTPTNDVVHLINTQVNEKIPGESTNYYSIDSVEDADERQRNLFPQEYLNSLSLSGMPPHKLELKIGSPIILLRNIQGDKGLCN